MKNQNHYCKDCHYCSRGELGMVYCSKNNYYPDALFMRVWGCYDFKEKYINLLDEKGD